MFFTFYYTDTGEIAGTVDVPSLADAIPNAPAGTAVVSGAVNKDTHYFDAEGIPVARPDIPDPTAPDNDMVIRWTFPPPGFKVKVYDEWTAPPTLLIETPLSAPNCGLQFTLPYSKFIVEMTADFPWIPRTIEVNT